jgi:putative peptidoglycan lipid II flippase
MHEAAILLGVFALLSDILSLVRDRLLAHQIGPSATLDVYYAAFRIPDLIYLSVASLASVTVIMPFLVSRMGGDGSTARKFFNDVLTGFVLLLLVVCAVVYAVMPRIAHFVAPGFSPEQMHQLVVTSRIMLLSPVFLGLSNLLGTVTQVLRKFFIFSLSPIFYVLGVIAGIVVFYPMFGIYGLAIGVAVGAFLHALIQVPTIIAAGFTPRFSAKMEKASLRQVAALSLPRTLGLSMNSIALLVIVAIGSTLGVGAISIFNFSINLNSVPIGIIGISYAVASFPLLAEAFAKGDMKVWKEGVITAVRQIIFWSLPIAALFIVLRAQIVRVILGSGAFSWNDTRLTAAALALFSIGLIAQNMILVTVRAFYSAHNTRTPLIINTFSSLVIIGGAFGLLHIFNHVPVFRYFIESLMRVEDIPGTSVLMLPLAFSIGTLLNAWLHWIDLKRRYLHSNCLFCKSV